MKYTTTVTGSDGQLLSDETDDELGTLRDIAEWMRGLQLRQDFRYTINLELQPETQDEIDQLKEQFWTVREGAN